MTDIQDEHGTKGLNIGINTRKLKFEPGLINRKLVDDKISKLEIESTLSKLEIDSTLSKLKIEPLNIKPSQSKLEQNHFISKLLEEMQSYDPMALEKARAKLFPPPGGFSASPPEFNHNELDSLMNAKFNKNSTIEEVAVGDSLQEPMRLVSTGEGITLLAEIPKVKSDGEPDI